MSAFLSNPPRKKALPLSFGIERTIINELTKVEEVTEPYFIQTISEAFKLVYPDNLVEQHLPALIARVVLRIEELNGSSDSKNKTHVSKSLGTAYVEWLTKFDAEALCLYLANWHPEHAEKFYWETDFEPVQEAIRLKAQYDSQMSILNMESCMYGFGGRYKDDDSGNTGSNYDINSDEGVAALKALGF